MKNVIFKVLAALVGIIFFGFLWNFTIVHILEIVLLLLLINRFNNNLKFNGWAAVITFIVWGLGAFGHENKALIYFAVYFFLNFLGLYRRDKSQEKIKLNK